MSDGETIIVDGSNVAHEERTDDGDPKVANLRAMRPVLRDAGLDPIVIVLEFAGTHDAREESS